MRLLWLFLLGGCSQLNVDLQFVGTEAELKQVCGSDMIAEPLGCAYARGRSCKIIAYEPRSSDDHRRIETLGHELWHCVKGPAHI